MLPACPTIKPVPELVDSILDRNLVQNHTGAESSPDVATVWKEGDNLRRSTPLKTGRSENFALRSPSPMARRRVERSPSFCLPLCLEVDFGSPSIPRICLQKVCAWLLKVAADGAIHGCDYGAGGWGRGQRTDGARGGGRPELAVGAGGWMSSCYLRLGDSDLRLGIAGTNDQKLRQSLTARSPETSPAHPTPRWLPVPEPPCRRHRGTDGRPCPARRRDLTLPPLGDSLPCAPEIQIEKIRGYEAGGGGARDGR